VASADWRKRQQDCTVEDIKRLVAASDKQRYALEERQDGLYIRANQGHSIPGVRLLFSLSLSLIVYLRELHLTVSCCVVCACGCACATIADGIGLQDDHRRVALPHGTHKHFQ
jgi:hypothetical protein